jgi:hypothetical protein
MLDGKEAVLDAGAFLIQKLLEADEHLADFFGPSKIGHGIGN